MLEDVNTTRSLYSVPLPTSPNLSTSEESRTFGMSEVEEMVEVVRASIFFYYCYFHFLAVGLLKVPSKATTR